VEENKKVVINDTDTVGPACADKVKDQMQELI